MIRVQIMDSYQHQKGGGREQKQPPPQPPPTTSTSPPSATSSPSHEFSFTISLHSSTTPNTTSIPSKTKNPTSLAIDLSPADDIFFHGHLLPLHLLSHLPVSPRSSANSLDSFTLPITDFPDDQGSIKSYGDHDRSGDGDEDDGGGYRKREHKQSINGDEESEAPRGRSKLRSFSLFGIPRGKKARAGVVGHREDYKEKQKTKKVISFDMTQMLKRYARMVRPLLMFKGRRGEEGAQFRRQSHSFSGNVNRRKNQEPRAPQFSAPASIRTSPTNSGLLVPATTLPSSTSDQSTMEELQAAIQAAIAHCKNSIAAEEKLKA